MFPSPIGSLGLWITFVMTLILPFIAQLVLQFVVCSDSLIQLASKNHRGTNFVITVPLVCFLVFLICLS